MESSFRMDDAQASQDRARILQALELAQRGFGLTSPNPPVGAVIYKDDRLLGSGYHHRAGEPHAERMALADAVEKGHANELKGSTIYVTLEPCSSYGKTPPCTQGIIDAGISRVIYGMVDPDERHSGRADAVLQSAGVEVKGGVEEEACRAFLRPWIHTVCTGCPWVIAKIAATLDGRIVRAGGEHRISGEKARKYTHRLRLRSDAILVGGQTVRTDNPELTIRCGIEIPDGKEQPWRIVFTRSARHLSSDAKIFSDKYSNRTLVYEAVEDFQGVLRELYKKYGIVTLLLECGGHLLREWLERDLVQEWVQIVSPYIGGGDNLLLSGSDLRVEKILSDTQTLRCGEDFIIRGLLSKS